ncbi:zeta toxin family protein [Candidatus Avelusimicrobium faecicola]|uniref:zeta toxin family protein n=1 Tax=Candidatus Avelusimicrobium faecicola TaxID=3416205 RepID=UPI003D0F9607
MSGRYAKSAYSSRQRGAFSHSRVRSGKSFALESTLSGVWHLKTISLAKQNGYKVVIVYIFVDTVETCLERIKARVCNGGHPVPEEDVKRRFLRSRENFW